MNRSIIPWAFIVDAFVAMLPTIDAVRTHHDWTIFIWYWIILATLRYADGWVVGKGWALWLRIVTKVVIVIFFQALVLVSAIEECDFTGQNCHRLFY